MEESATLLGAGLHLEQVLSPRRSASLVAGVRRTDGRHEPVQQAPQGLDGAADAVQVVSVAPLAAGLAAFLVAHVWYLVGFWTDGPNAGAFLVAVVVVVALVAPLGWRILRAIARAGEPGELRIAVATDLGGISAMLATALATGNVGAGGGGGGPP